MVNRSGVYHRFSVFFFRFSDIYSLTKFDWVEKPLYLEREFSSKCVYMWASPESSEWTGRRARAVGQVRSSAVEFWNSLISETYDFVLGSPSIVP